MRVGMMLGYAGGFSETVDELADFERAGLDIVFVPEAYSFDAVSQLGFIAARTTRLEIASGILPIYSRTPALTAMTAAGLDYVSGGRFILGLGASGPQVIEGWHGVPYDAPVGRAPARSSRSAAKVWRRERLDYDGQALHAAAAAGQGTGLGKPLKLINHPVGSASRSSSPRSARRTSSWPPRSPRAGSRSSTSPRRRPIVWGAAARRGHGQARPGAGPAGRIAPAAAGHRRRRRRPARPGQAATWRSTSAAWAPAAGTSTTTWPAGTATRARRTRSRTSTWPAARTRPPPLVPADLVEKTALIGPAGYVAERLAAFRAAGVTTLNVTPLAATHAARLADIERVRALAGERRRSAPAGNWQSAPAAYGLRATPP